MQLPFTVGQFYAVFRDYNETVWPAQVLLLAAAGVAIALVVAPRRRSGAAGMGISAILAFLWAWLGLAYHYAFFTAISTPAYGFAALSVAGALVFFWQGVVRRKLVFAWGSGPRSLAGLGLLAFALVVYPAWSHVAGHPFPETPTFGVPCPTTIFTLGLLAFLVEPHPRSPLVVPVVWSFIGAQAAFLLGVPQDLGLAVAGVFGIALIARSIKRNLRTSNLPSPLGAIPVLAGRDALHRSAFPSKDNS